MELDLHLVLAEGLHRGVQVDLLLFDLHAGLDQLLVDVGGGDRTEQLAALAGLDGERDGDLGDLIGQRLGAGQFGDLALGAALLQRLDALAVGLGEGDSKLLREEVITGVAGADFDLVAFGAQTVNGLEEQNFVMSHDGICV